MKVASQKSTQVPHQFLGYSLQVQRVLARLLISSPEAIVSLEVIDDVGVEFSDGTSLVEQGKKFSSSNPVSDRSENLWKTFSNWVMAVVDGALDPNKTTFIMYLFSPYDGGIVKRFSTAKTLEEARQALEYSRELLWGKPPDYLSRKTISPNLEPYVNRIFTTNEELVAKIILNFSLETGSGDTNEDVRNLLQRTLVPEDILDATFEFSLGWVKEQIDSRIEQGKPAAISGAEFRRKVTAFIRKNDRRSILSSFAKDPSPEDITTGLSSLRTYILQLELIDSEEDEKIEAIIDYLKAGYDRTNWSIHGLVEEESFDEFEEGLIRAWDKIKKRIGIDLQDRDDITRGKRIYLDCSLQKAKLEGIEVPDHFTPGSFHALSDDERIGWHPNYKNLLPIKKAI